MNKLLFVLICGCLMSAATVTVRAQSEYTIEQGTFIDCELNESNLEMRKAALARPTDQEVLKKFALEDKRP
jgi:uncharacterized lipoprotein NlpE involved in copper resistance